MPWIMSLFDRTDDHSYDKISFDSFKVINEASADVTDEHVSAILERIIASGSKNIVSKKCKQIYIENRYNEGTSQKTC